MAMSDAAGPHTRREELLRRYEEITEWPLLILAVLMIPLLLAPIAMDVSGATNSGIETTLWIIWGIFAIDLIVRTYLAERRINYLVRHWYDVLIVVVPFLRPLRIARSARALRLLRLSRVVPFAVRIWADTGHILRRRSLHMVLLSGIFAVFAAAALVLVFERNGGGTIDDYGTALWWAMTTVTTVGYGDTFPTTPEGKGIAVVLMLIGISFFSWVTANIAAFLVEFGGGEQDGVTTRDLMAKLEQMEAEIKALREERLGGAGDLNGASRSPSASSEPAGTVPTSELFPGP